MADFAWIGAQEDLSAAALTVRAQTVDPTDDGALLWDTFFPRENVDSVKFSEMSTIDFRPVADRREWNQRGRLIPLKTPPTREFEMTPIEAYFSIAEREMQHLEERTLGNEAAFQQIVRNQIPPRTDDLVSALYRRIEVEAFEAWSKGTITAYNPQIGSSQVVSFGYDTARYGTAGTAWDDTSVNAYALLLAWLESSIPYVGSFSGVVLRNATFQAILADAPNKFIPDSSLALSVTRSQLNQLIRDDLGQDFTFYIIEKTVEPFTDGGIATSSAAVWPAQYVGLVPAGENMGTTKFAPVARAMELARQVPGAGIDIRGATVYHSQAGNGRELTVEAQFNAMTVPNEQKVFVIDAGV